MTGFRTFGMALKTSGLASKLPGAKDDFNNYDGTRTFPAERY